MPRLAAEGAQVCVTVTHLDGLVLARSAFHHSMNYRSAMIYGAFEVVGADRNTAALDAFLDHIAQGRAHEVRAGNRNELAATTVLRLPLDEAVAKIRTGGSKDDDEDLARPVSAGVLPLALTPLAPEPDGAQPEGGVPGYVTDWTRRAGSTG